MHLQNLPAQLKWVGPVGLVFGGMQRRGGGPQMPLVQVTGHQWASTPYWQKVLIKEVNWFTTIQRKTRQKMRYRYKQVHQDVGSYTWLWRRSQIRSIRLDMNCVLPSSTLTNLEAQRFCLDKKDKSRSYQSHIPSLLIVWEKNIGGTPSINKGCFSDFFMHCNKKWLGKNVSYLLGGLAREASNMHWQKLLRTTLITWWCEGKALIMLHRFVNRKYDTTSFEEYIPCHGSQRRDNRISEIWWPTAWSGHQDSQERLSSGCARSWIAGLASLMSITRVDREKKHKHFFF